jgi:UDP-glucose 4-epimerase
MTILITGATGLVGERLLTRLVEARHKCRALIRNGAVVPAGVTAVEGDLLDAASLIEAVKDISDIIHLAATFRTTDTDLIWRVNLEGTRNLIAAAQTHTPDARFILASTTNIYGVDGARPGREDDVVDPQQAYPASKLAAEREVQASGLNWSVQRFGFVYGDQDGHLEALPGHAARGGWHPALRMSVIHHRDIATAMQLALTGAMDGRVVNIVDDAPTSIYELAVLVGETLPPSSSPLTNPWHFHVDSSLARSLGFQPNVRTIYQAVQEQLL